MMATSRAIGMSASVALSGAIFTRDLDRARKLASRIETGNLAKQAYAQLEVGGLDKRRLALLAEADLRYASGDQGLIALSKSPYLGRLVELDLEQDCWNSRDFTFNAIAKSLETGELLDPHGGEVGQAVGQRRRRRERVGGIELGVGQGRDVGHA